MGKKSKANRKKAPVATAEATAMVAATTTATALERGTFPESTFFVKGESLCRKGNYSKATKVYLQGIDNGCVRCMFAYTMKILSDGKTHMDFAELVKNNMNLHLALPLLLEGAIRGNHEAVLTITGVFSEYCYETADLHHYGHGQPALPLILYWKKIGLKNYAREDRTQKKTRDQRAEGMSRYSV